MRTQTYCSLCQMLHPQNAATKFVCKKREDHCLYVTAWGVARAIGGSGTVDPTNPCSPADRSRAVSVSAVLHCPCPVSLTCPGRQRRWHTDHRWSPAHRAFHSSMVMFPHGATYIHTYFRSITWLLVTSTRLGFLHAFHESRSDDAVLSK